MNDLGDLQLTEQMVNKSFIEPCVYIGSEYENLDESMNGYLYGYLDEHLNKHLDGNLDGDLDGELNIDSFNNFSDLNSNINQLENNFEGNNNEIQNESYYKNYVERQSNKDIIPKKDKINSLTKKSHNNDNLVKSKTPKIIKNHKNINCGKKNILPENHTLKRGRGRIKQLENMTEEEKQAEKDIRLAKNRTAARYYRNKRKEYLINLENKIAFFKKRDQLQTQEIIKLKNKVDKLQNIINQSR